MFNKIYEEFKMYRPSSPSRMGNPNTYKRDLRLSTKPFPKPLSIPKPIYPIRDFPIRDIHTKNIPYCRFCNRRFRHHIPYPYRYPYIYPQLYYPYLDPAYLDYEYVKDYPGADRYYSACYDKNPDGSNQFVGCYNNCDTSNEYAKFKSFSECCNNAYEVDSPKLRFGDGGNCP